MTDADRVAEWCLAFRNVRCDRVEELYSNRPIPGPADDARYRRGPCQPHDDVLPHADVAGHAADTTALDRKILDHRIRQGVERVLNFTASLDRKTFFNSSLRWVWGRAV